MKKGLTPAKTTRPRGRRTAIDWGTFPGQSIAVGPCGPGEHNSKLIRSRRPRQARHSTGLARDARQLPERFTLEAKVFADATNPTAVARGSEWTNRQRATGATS